MNKKAPKTSVGKQPYIPLYIGDWEQDVNSISLEAEGALLKLVFKLWKSDTKGLLEISYPQLEILLKKGAEMTVKILQELKENSVLNIEFLSEKKVKIESRRMTKEVELSKRRSEIGSMGGNQKEKNKKIKASKTLPKSYQNAEIDIDNDNEVNKIKSLEKWDLIFPFDSKEFREKWNHWRAYLSEIKKPYNNRSSEQAALQLLSAFPEQTAIAMIQQSIEKQWKSIFELTTHGNTITKNQRNSNNSGVLELAKEALGNLGRAENRDNAGGGTG